MPDDPSSSSYEAERRRLNDWLLGGGCATTALVAARFTARGFTAQGRGQPLFHRSTLFVPWSAITRVIARPSIIDVWTESWWCSIAAAGPPDTTGTQQLEADLIEHSR